MIIWNRPVVLTAVTCSTACMLVFPAQNVEIGIKDKCFDEAELHLFRPDYITVYIFKRSSDDSSSALFESEFIIWQASLSGASVLAQHFESDDVFDLKATRFSRSKRLVKRYIPGNNKFSVVDIPQIISFVIYSIPDHFGLRERVSIFYIFDFGTTYQHLT